MARLVFLGTPEVAVPPLETLVGLGHDVLTVVTRADKRRGRGGALVASPVKQAALGLGLPVTSSLEGLGEMGADLGVVVAFGRIIPPGLLAALPMVNLHFSLLPRWRGAAPVERAILAGDPVTGVDLMAVEEGLDTGGIYARRELEIGEDETADGLRARLVAAGCELLEAHLGPGPVSLPEPTPQVGEATYAEKLTPEDVHLEWSEPAVLCHRRVRLGRAWTTFRGKRLRVLAAERVAGFGGPPGALAPGPLAGAGDGGALRLVTVQVEGRSPVDGGDWWRGARVEDGERLGT